MARRRSRSGLGRMSLSEMSQQVTGIRYAWSNFVLFHLLIVFLCPFIFDFVSDTFSFSPCRGFLWRRLTSFLPFYFDDGTLVGSSPILSFILYGQ